MSRTNLNIFAVAGIFYHWRNALVLGAAADLHMRGHQAVGAVDL